jgi:hypothetical protein
VTRLRFVTSDGFLQSYIALRERHTAHGDWIELRLPMRPNGRTGWVRREALDTFSVVHTQIVLDRAQHRLTLFRDGTVVLTAPIGVGKPSTPTPRGHFWITEKFAVHGAPVYGPYAMGTSDYSTLSDWPGGGIVGLHGTDEPQLVPGDPSHGCVRLHNSDIVRLARLVPIGTPLLIIYGVEPWRAACARAGACGCGADCAWRRGGAGDAWPCARKRGRPSGARARAAWERP